jgi:hypothetical protein
MGRELARAVDSSQVALRSTFVALSLASSVTVVVLRFVPFDPVTLAGSTLTPSLTTFSHTFLPPSCFPSHPTPIQHFLLP